MARKTTGAAKGPKTGPKAATPDKGKAGIVAQNAPEEAVQGVSGNDVVVDAKSVFAATPPVQPVVDVERMKIESREGFVTLRESRIDNGIIERMDVWDVPGNGAMFRFVYIKGGQVQGVPQVLFVDNIRPDFEKKKIIRSLR